MKIKYSMTLISSYLNLVVALVCGIFGVAFLENVGKVFQSMRMKVCKRHSVFCSDK